MSNKTNRQFAELNTGFNSVFKPKRLSIGLVIPIEGYPHNAVPTMQDHMKRVQLAEELGFRAVWMRDVPFNVPSFGDAGQTFDPFVYLGALATQTSTIALGIASLILPLRHPAHIAKAAASADVISNGRLLLGIASGDRPEEYPALNVAYDQRGELFRQSHDYIREMSKASPQFSNDFGHVSYGADLLPKPTASRIPLLVTGSSQQSPDWIAKHCDGWMTYPRPTAHQAQFVNDFRSRVEAVCEFDKPVMEPLHVDLVDNADAEPERIHLGLRLGINTLREYLNAKQELGVNHIAINLRFNQKDTTATLRKLALEILPEFS